MPKALDFAETEFASCRLAQAEFRVFVGPRQSSWPRRAEFAFVGLVVHSAGHLGERSACSHALKSLSATPLIVIFLVRALVARRDLWPSAGIAPPATGVVGFGMTFSSCVVTICNTLHTLCEVSSNVLYNRMANETRTANIMVRMTPALKALVEKAAKADTRSLSSLIEKVLTEHLKATGYLKK